MGILKMCRSLSLPNEYWAYVDGYNGIYMVSNLGRVKSMPRKIIKGKRTYYTSELVVSACYNKGYKQVALSNGVNKKSHRVHVLVACAFIPNPQNKPNVNHKNGIKDDNKIENLEWNTQKENVNHAFANNLVRIPKGSQKVAAKLKESQVWDIRERFKNNNKEEYENVAREYGVSGTCIKYIVINKTWKHVTESAVG